MNQQRLKELLNYDPVTGVFKHIFSRHGVTVGKKAGYINSDGYIYIILDKKKYVSHRLIWLYVYGAYPINQLDHINRIRHDNTLLNLREVTLAENRQNLGLSLKNKSGFRGVSKDPKTELWRVNISVKNKSKYVGRFSTLSEAADAYAMAAKLYHTHNPMAAL